MAEPSKPPLFEPSKDDNPLSSAIKEVANHVVDFIREAVTKVEVILLFLFFGAITIYSISFSVSFDDVILFLLNFIKHTWWIFLLFPLFWLFWQTWLYYRQQLFQAAIKWKMYELRFPLEIERSPAAMEQVLRVVHAQMNAPGNFQERWIDGEITRPMACEIVSFGGELHFYMRIYAKLGGILKAAMYSYYPDVEMEEVDDYMEKLPQNLREMYDQGMDMFGSELLLNKSPAFPIKTYEYFEHPDDKRFLDPLSSFIEMLGAIGTEDFVGLQYLIAPIGSKWVTEEEDTVKELKEKASSSSDPTKLLFPSPGERDLLQLVEKNLSKPAFEVVCRMLYVGPKSTFFPDFARKGLLGAFQQFQMNNLNSFRHNAKVWSRAQVWDPPFVIVDQRVEMRKQRNLWNYLNRETPIETWMGKLISSYWLNLDFSRETFIMNVEGIASLFHPPTNVVLTAPFLKRIEAKRAGPPAGLAIFGEESELESFQK